MASFFNDEFGRPTKELHTVLGALILQQAHDLNKFQRIMIASGFKSLEAHRVWIKMNKWQSVHRRAVRFVMNLEWFRKQGLIFLNDFTKQSLEQSLFSR